MNAAADQHFTPQWRRPRRTNDILISNNDIDTPFWRRYPCLVCGRPPPGPPSAHAPSPAPSAAHVHVRENSSSSDGQNKNTLDLNSSEPDVPPNAVSPSTNPFDSDYQPPPPKNPDPHLDLSKKSADTLNKTTKDSSLSCHHKRCSRCHSTIYCSASCQRQDYIRGKHKASCLAIGELWKEKERLEHILWENCRDSNDNNYEHNKGLKNDDNNYYPIVGRFWKDHPETEQQKDCVNYCVVLLQLVQLLGRAESWRVSRIPANSNETDTSAKNDDKLAKEGKVPRKKTTNIFNPFKRGVGNPLARELAIDLAYTLLHLDRTDMRVRLLIPSLLLEGGYYQEAYDYLKYWLRAESSLMIMDLALMGGGEMDQIGAKAKDGDEEECEKIENAFLGLKGEDMLEPPEHWMDGEMVYPSVGMVMELAFLKCHLLTLLNTGHFHQIIIQSGADEEELVPCFADNARKEIATISFAQRIIEVGAEELKRQVHLLLSLVHKWNPHLLPKLGEPYNVIMGAASVTEHLQQQQQHLAGGISPPTPPALTSLLDIQPPGFELQYRMGNAGGQSLDEAVSIWQRDMILWHYVNPETMVVLSGFCRNLDTNVVDVSGLTGGPSDDKDGSGKWNVNLVSGSDLLSDENTENRMKRKEAEELVTKLQKENPNRSLDQIMMHPEMAQLMIKHLHTS